MVTTKTKKKRPQGVQVAVSRQAHEIMIKKAFQSKPRKTIRAIINIMNGLPEDQ